jgi:hypothetical protein
LLAELVQQRSELARWIADEKAKTVMWCEEQRAGIAKERRAAAKQSKESRLSATTAPSRKERAEVESLQATIEKLKVEAESAAKKFRLTERRLLQNIKDQLTAAEEQNQLMLSLEKDKMELLEVVALNDVHSAAGGQGLRNKRLAAEVSRLAAAVRARKGVDSYVEEVPVYQERADDCDDGDDDRYLDDSSSQLLVVASEVRASLNRGVGVGVGRYSADENSLQAATAQPSRTNGLIKTAGHETTGIQPKPHTSVVADSLRTSQEGYGTTQTQTHAFESIAYPSAPRGLLNGTVTSSSVQAAVAATDREEQVTVDGTRVLRYRNGTVKEIAPNGDTVVKFTNGDTKRTVAGESKTIYFYSEARTTHTTYGDGSQRYEFPNGQIESHFSDGRKEIAFPDGTRKTVFVNGVQESRFVDGVVVREHPHGLREIITPDGKVIQDFG